MIKRLAACIREYKRPTILTPVCMVGEVVCECTIPLLTADLINAIQNGCTMQTILSFGLKLFVIAMLSLGFGSLSGWFAAEAAAGFAKNLRHDLYYQVQGFSFANIDRFSTSSLVTRLTTDVTNIQNAFMMCIRIAVRAPMMLVFAVVMSVRVGKQLALIFAGIVPVLGFALFLMIRSALPLFKAVFKKYDALNNSVQENVQAMRVVKSFVREDYETQKFSAASDSVRADFLKAEKILALNSPVMQFCVYTSMILISFFAAKLTGGALPEGLVSSIMPIRLPRVLCVALTGASLSLAGAAMQGLLKNPLADGSTLGVSSGASLGAVCAIAFGVTLPGFPFAGTMVMAILFAFGSLLVILGLSYKLDRSLSTNTIILIGVIFSMFVSSIMSIVITFAADKVQKITFWTMGSLSGSTYQNAAVLALALAVCGAVILLHAQILNAFAVGEDNARQIGVDVKRAKLVLLITVSVLIGVCVSIGGTIGFVGLVTPHMARMLVGPNHRRLLPAAMFGGAVFLMLADLVARTLLNPLELPIGVVTSFVGAIVFVVIFYQSRKEH
mgnify:CR=1 FL=1